MLSTVVSWISSVTSRAPTVPSPKAKRILTGAPTKLAFGEGKPEAWIAVEGEPVECHSISTSFDGKTMTGYIESLTGDLFSIHCRAMVENEHGWAVTPQIDGVMDKHDRRYLNGVSAIQENFVGWRDSPTSIKPYVFKEIVGYTADSSSTSTANMGIIRVDVEGYVSIGTSPLARVYSPIPEGRKAVLSEKCTLSHQATFADGQEESTSGSVIMMQRVSPEACYTFEFHYLSRDLLLETGRILGTESRKEVEKEDSE